MKPGDRIGQLVITPFIAPAFVEAAVTEDHTDRGLNRYGSPGVAAKGPTSDISQLQRNIRIDVLLAAG